MKYAEQAAHGKAFDLKATVQYCCDQIKQIIEKIGPRAPGSPQELEAHKMMAKELEQWADDVQIEDFTVHRQAFMGFIPLSNQPLGRAIQPIVSSRARRESGSWGWDLEMLPRRKRMTEKVAAVFCPAIL